MLQYATLQEAWGEAVPPTRKKTKRPPPPADFTENVVVPDLAAKYRAPAAADDWATWAMYDKEESQRSDEPQSAVIGPAKRYPESAAKAAEPGVTAPEDPPYESGRVSRPLLLDPMDAAFQRGHPGFDVALYVFSGIALILLLEQFVQMGRALQR